MTANHEKMQAGGQARGLPGSLRGPVLQVITSTARRGAEVSAIEMGTALTSRGYRVHTVALAPGYDPCGVDVPSLGRTPLGIGTLRALRTEVAKVSIAVACGSRTLPACAIATPGTGTPFVYLGIGDPRHWAGSAARRLRVTLLLSRARAIVVLWPGAARALVDSHHVSPAKIRIIPNCRPAARFPPVDDARKAAARAGLGLDAKGGVALYVGSLGREKNVQVAIAALRQLPGVELLVVGDGPERHRLQTLAAEVAPGRVRFLGTSHEPSRIMAAADALVLPSATEGMPGVLIEAGLSALPVVATDVGGVSEIVVEGETGRLVRPGDHDALAAALRETLDHPGAMGQAARARCLARFETEAVTAVWDSFLSEMLKHEGPTARA